MKISTEQSLRDFKFWSGARDRVKCLTLEELDQIEAILEDAYPESTSDTTINDLFWFDEDTIAYWLGYNDFDEIMYRNDDEDDDEQYFDYLSEFDNAETLWGWYNCFADSDTTPEQRRELVEQFIREMVKIAEEK